MRENNRKRSLKSRAQKVAGRAMSRIVALGRKEEAMQECRRAMEMRPVFEDAIDGPSIALKVAVVYAWANEPDLAFEQLNSLIHVPRRGPCLNYGDIKTNPEWDPLRKDPRFDKLLAELAPRD